MASEIDHFVKFVNAQLSSVETMGKIAGASFYRELANREQERVNQLTDELAQLQAALNEGVASGAIAYGSQAWYELRKQIFSVEEAIWDANNAILEFEQKIKNVAKENFDDLVNQFQNAIDILTSKIDLTDNIISMVESTGHIVSKRYYESLVSAEDQNIKNLKKKYDELNKVFEEAVASGDVEPYSDQWYELRSGVEDVKNEIVQATQKLIEYKNAMRQIDWDLFDRGQTRLEQLVSESQFLIDLYADSPLFDKETGDITDKGMATKGLHVQNYETYKNAVQQYAEEIAKLKEEMARDPGDTNLIDRYHNLLDAQRQAILNMQNEKKALKDLAEEGYNALLDALKKLIDKYKTALDHQKDKLCLSVMVRKSMMYSL